MPLNGATIEIGEGVTDLGWTIGTGGGVFGFGVMRIGAGVFGTGVGDGVGTLAIAFVP